MTKIQPSPVTSAQHVKLAIEHLKMARHHLIRAGAARSVERVRAALSSAKGALRHASLEPLRRERQASAQEARK